MPLSTATIAQTLRNQGITLFSEKSYNHKRNAQLNLEGRTHYVDDKTLSFFKSRIISSDIQSGGLIFWMIESVSLNPNHTARGFRYVAFDVYGTVISHVALEDCAKTKAAARNAFWEWFECIDIVAHYAGVFERRAARLEREASELPACLTTA